MSEDDLNMMFDELLSVFEEQREAFRHKLENDLDEFFEMTECGRSMSGKEKDSLRAEVAEMLEVGRCIEEASQKTSNRALKFLLHEMVMTIYKGPGSIARRAVQEASMRMKTLSREIDGQEKKIKKEEKPNIQQTRPVVNGRVVH